MAASRRQVLTGLPALLALGPAPAFARHRHLAHRAPSQPQIPASLVQTAAGPVGVEARWAYIMDATTGAVLLQKAADDLMPPSSLTKLMTAYVVFSALRAGRLRLDQSLPVSERAWRMQGSKMFVPVGQEVSVEDLIRGMLIQSGNDACIVLAEGLSGSEEAFVQLMNEEAVKLGLTHSTFRNATGWPDPEHHMSARDVAVLALHLVRDFPQYYHYFSEHGYKFGNIDQGNRNVLVDKGLADGLKTGHTEAGGFGLCASSERDGRRIIEVLNGLPSSRARVEEGERMLAWAFASFEDVRLFKAGETVQRIPVWLGQHPDVAAVTTEDVVVTVPHGWRHRMKVHVDFQQPVQAPVRAGAPLGQLIVSDTGLSDFQLPLVAAGPVARLGLPNRAIAVLGHTLGGG